MSEVEIRVEWPDEKDKGTAVLKRRILFTRWDDGITTVTGDIPIECIDMTKLRGFLNLPDEWVPGDGSPTPLGRGL